MKLRVKAFGRTYYFSTKGIIKSVITHSNCSLWYIWSCAWWKMILLTSKSLLCFPISSPADSLRSLHSPNSLVRCLSSHYKEQISQEEKYFLQVLIGQKIQILRREMRIVLFNWIHFISFQNNSSSHVLPRAGTANLKFSILWCNNENLL